MNEHKLLKQICDTIWYEYFYREDYWLFLSDKVDSPEWHKVWSIRDIIFTTEFMDKLVEYIDFKLPTLWNVYWQDRLLENLDNPIQYLADLLWITNE